MIKLMFGGDLHKKIVDPPSIIGYRDCTFRIQRNIMQMIKELGVTHFISLGDWYDRGFHTDNATAIPEYDMDIEMYHLLNGNFYGLIGNHIKLGLDTNPELFLIQPHDRYRPRTKVWRDYQIIKTPSVLKFGDIQISFMHFDGSKKSLLEYKPIRDNGARIHIVLFHTPWIVPNQQLLKVGLNPNSYTVSSIGECLEGVDIAICGDIHDPIGKFTVSHQYGETLMIVPGSLTNTTSNKDHRHSVVYLPVITVDESNMKPTLEFKQIDLMINTLKFKDNETKKEEQKKLDGIRAKRKDVIQSEGELRSVFDYSAPDAYSMHNLALRKGYDSKDMAMIKSIMANPYDVDSLVKIYNDSDEVAL